MNIKKTIFYFILKTNVAYHTRTYANVRIRPPNWTYANIRNYARHPPKLVEKVVANAKKRGFNDYMTRELLLTIKRGKELVARLYVGLNLCFFLDWGIVVCNSRVGINC